MSKISKNSYLHEFCAQLSQIVSLAEWPFYGLLELYEQKYHKTHISASSVNKYKKIEFLAYLTVLRLFTTVWAKMSQNSYLREFCAQVSQIVFLADLTVLRLNTTVWAKFQKTRISASSVH